MATISSSGIQPQQIIKSEHLLRIIAALSGQTNNDIIISGSLKTVSSNIVDFVSSQYVTGSFKGDGSQLTGLPTGSGGSVIPTIQQVLNAGSTGSIVGDNENIHLNVTNNAESTTSDIRLNSSGNTEIGASGDIILTGQNIYANALRLITRVNVDGDIYNADEYGTVNLPSTEGVGWTTPQEYGAKGDGTTDDTDAVKQCLEENLNILLYGKYKVTDKLSILSNQLIYANNATISSTTTDDAILESDNKDAWVIEGKLTIEGSGKANNTASGLRVIGGIKYEIKGVTIQNIPGKGFDFVNGTSVSRGDRGMLSNCYSLNNWYGVYVGPIMQYVSMTSFNISGNEYGAYVLAGNITFAASNLVDNKNGLFVGGTFGNNNSHGIFSGVNINHNDILGVGYNIRLENVEEGQTFSGCHIYGDINRNIEIVNSKGAHFVGCIIDGKIENIDDYPENKYTHLFASCQLNAWTSRVGVIDNLIFRDCFKMIGGLHPFNYIDPITTDTHIVTTNHPLGAAYTDKGNFSIITTDTQEIDKGGSMSMGGKWYTTPGNQMFYSPFARLSGRKQDDINSSIKGYFALELSDDLSDPSFMKEALRVLSEGKLLIGQTSSTSDAKLQVTGKGKFTGTVSGVNGVNDDDFIIKEQYDDLGNSDFFKESDFEKSYIAAATSDNIRNSEGDILVLNNGNYLSVYSRFGLDSTDQAPASIRGKISTDNSGKNWGNEFEVSSNIGTKNILSVSLLRINSTTIDCFFLVRNSVTDLGLWRVRSDNEGFSWDAPIEIINDGYTDILSAVVKRSNSNRILIPGESVPNGSAGILNWDIFCYKSDDNGTTYTKSNVVNISGSSGETSVCWLGGNNVLFSTRTDSGYQWFTKSTDNGTTLGTPYQSTLESVDAPAQIINYSGTLIALHNPNTEDDRRNPLSISKSTDGGDTWIKISDLENFNEGSNDVRYAYPSLTLDGDNLLISYFELAGKLGRISLKFSKINIPDLLAGTKPTISGADNIKLPNLVLNDASDVSPTDGVTSAIAKLQTQINQLKGFRYEYNGTGEAIALINNDPSNELENLYITFRNTDGSVVSELGHIGADGNYYIYSTKPVTLLSPKTITEGVAIFHNKLAIGTDSPLQDFVVSRGGNEGLEITVDDAVNKIVGIQAYDRTAGVYRQINITASKILLNAPTEVIGQLKIEEPTSSTSAASKGYVDNKIMYGSTVITMNGIDTVFNIPHGMGSVPSSFSISFGDAGNLNFTQSQRTLTSTNITITCDTPPLPGSQTVYWQVYK